MTSPLAPTHIRVGPGYLYGHRARFEAIGDPPWVGLEVLSSRRETALRVYPVGFTHGAPRNLQLVDDLKTSRYHYRRVRFGANSPASLLAHGVYRTRVRHDGLHLYGPIGPRKTTK